VVGDEPAILLDFLGNIDQLGSPTSKDRIVTTLVMTDIVDSTATASRPGDTTWKQLLVEHNRLVRSRLERYLGQEVNTTGDGFLAMFASARGAIRCAMSIRDATAGIGLPVRIGIHTGEIELLPGDIGGVVVHAVARVMALGGASDIMVSSSTRSLVDDDALHFESKGEHELKGLANSLGVFALLDWSTRSENEHAGNEARAADHHETPRVWPARSRARGGVGGWRDRQSSGAAGTRDDRDPDDDSAFATVAPSPLGEYVRRPQRSVARYQPNDGARPSFVEVDRAKRNPLTSV
jgi:class 3 adenylate cyclase